MSAKDAVSKSQFPPDGPVYHGSPQGFAPKDTIEPHNDGTHLKKGEKAAFGVTNTNTAGYFALERAREPREGQGRLFASVYEVDPKSQFDLHPIDQKQYDNAVKYRKDYHPMPDTPVNNMPIDRKGFTVKRHAAFVMPNLEQQRKGYLVEDIQETPGGVG